MDMDKKIPVYMWDPNAVITVSVVARFTNID